MPESTNLTDQQIETATVTVSEKFSTGSKFALCIEFSMRPERNFQVMLESWSPPTVSFFDVRRHKNSGSAHLMCQTVPFAKRETLGDVVTEIGEIHRHLPRFEIPKADDFGHMKTIGKARTQTRTSNCQSPIPNPQSPVL